MFIRKRTNKRRDGTIGECYQVIKTYREGGKVKQKVLVNLRGYPTIDACLEHHKRWVSRLAEGIADLEKWMANRRRHWERWGDYHRYARLYKLRGKRLERYRKLRDEAMQDIKILEECSVIFTHKIVEDFDTTRAKKA